MKKTFYSYMTVLLCILAIGGCDSKTVEPSVQMMPNDLAFTENACKIRTPESSVKYVEVKSRTYCRGRLATDCVLQVIVRTTCSDNSYMEYQVEHPTR